MIMKLQMAAEWTCWNDASQKCNLEGQHGEFAGVVVYLFGNGNVTKQQFEPRRI